MNEIQEMCRWLTKWNYDIIIARNTDKIIAFFYRHNEDIDLQKRAVYVIAKYEKDNSIHIGNVFLANGIAKIGLLNIISVSSVTESNLYENISEIANVINNEESINYYNKLMHYPQKFSNVSSIINQYISRNHCTIINSKSKEQ